MIGYDALDELYERLRDAEETQHAQRAGGITPEAIRAARGGAVDESGRTHATAAENAADGDSEPLVDIPCDTRERIEADLLALTESWHDYDGDFMKIYSSVAYAQVKELLDRQAALTEREACAYCDYKDANRRQAHKIHEVCKCLEDSHEREKKLQAEVDELNAQNTRLNAKWAAANTQVEKLQAELDHARFKPRTVEDVLRDLADAARLDRAHLLDDGDIEGYAAEIRELMEVER